ncbi:DNA polymerase III subunit delta [Terrimonas sp. NA20]|uniref:DNA polymerase III subunit delta n=1 Tax=Terrimonas ginsenosidimutans TaxID=2908004 RepID=A0ABS9KWD2_9BACT|nr:DNA polymerase III subunit delta [Terrimonas ginsenosidimutans]MCG2616654.1 DNA polymerase III subunit delta [Terrimonas ginsenosidimutans]
MAVEKIIAEWKKGVFKPVYWLEGEEEYFIDKVINYAEHNLLPESEASFNLSIFYGRDSNWADIVNACRRYPMFAERQVVVLKEAQQMRDIEKLEGYVENPLSSTVFVVSYKDKKVDGRTKFAKVLKEKGVFISTKKIYDSQLPDWTQELLRSKDLSISPKGLALLIDHIGNDLSRIENEIEKISVNLAARKNITEDDIEEFVGVSKDFNVFELQAALAKKDLAKSIRIIQYFESNPKAAPIQLILPSLYGFFSKVFMVFGAGSQDEKAIASAIGVNPFFVKDYLHASRVYDYTGVERVLLLLHQYNLKSIGVNAAPTEDGSLMKEMVYKIMA